jgi:hypothetical protein
MEGIKMGHGAVELLCAINPEQGLPLLERKREIEEGWKQDRLNKLKAENKCSLCWGYKVDMRDTMEACPKCGGTGEWND